jgi:integrase
VTKKLTALTKDPKKRDDHDIFELPDGAHGFGGPVLDVRSKGTDRRWSCKAVFRGERITVQLGTVKKLSTVSAAKQAMAKARGLCKQDIDPRENLRQDRDTVPTFGQHAEAFMDDYVPTLKNSHHQDKWRASVRNHCKTIWNIKVDHLLTSDVLRVLKPIWKSIPVMASEVRARMEVIIDDATFKNYRTGDNPAKWSLQMQRALGGKPPKSGETRGAHKSVPPDQMPTLMAALRAKGTQSARALYAIALSCLRSQEFVQMHTRELDLDAAQPTWTVPKERFKVDPHNNDFKVPLAPQFVAILREQLGFLEQIFPHSRGVAYSGYLWPQQRDETDNEWISDATMLRYLQRTMGVDATVHGFRASYKTWAMNQFLEGTDATPKYHHYAIEFCQAHTTPGGKGSSENPYMRDQMMFPARVFIMRDWANYCDPMPKPAALPEAA